MIIPTGMLIMWLSAIASAFVDNIPFVATHDSPDQGHAHSHITGDSLNYLWWCLSLGACLGGNGTIIGASANVVVVGMAEKRGLPITFVGFLKTAFPLMLMSIVISSGYMLLWYILPTVPTLIAVLGLALLVGIALSLFNRRLYRTA